MKHLSNYRNFLFEQSTTAQKFETDYTIGNAPLPESNKTYKLPYDVTWKYDAKGSIDKKHAFQDTSGTPVGNMNVVIKEWLEHFYSKGINPEVSSVDVKINGDIVTWTATISESTDGKAWVGFTSRGRGSVSPRLKDKNGNDIVGSSGIEQAYANTYSDSEKMDRTAKKSISSKFPNSEIKGVPTTGGSVDPLKGPWDTIPYFRWVDTSGNNGITQFFVKYTKPQTHPPHQNNAGSNNSSTTTQTNQPTTTTQQQSTQQQSTATTGFLIDEKDTDADDLRKKVKSYTNISIDENSIEVDFESNPLTFKCKKGNTQVFLLSLLWSNKVTPRDLESAQNAIDKNKTDYPNSKILKEGDFTDDEGKKRRYAVVGLIK